ncbi:hypothetical protein [Phenylobacterium sp.]|uniref:hypothetical protein n=1 Tax=Phenylobacterium sp. TaxID=1871053 RepID=UPI0035B37AF5
MAELVGGRYRIRPGRLFDAAGAVSDALPLIIAATHPGAGDEGGEDAEVSTVAAVADIVDVLTEESLTAAYARIASAKRLAKGQHRDTPNDASNGTLGLVFARSIDGTVEQIVERLQALNAETPGGLWLDRLVINGVCALEYGIQFPGTSALMGWFPPTPDNGLPYQPGIYVILTMTVGGHGPATGAATWLLQHLQLFRRPTDIPELPKPDPADRKAIVVSGFQYNLAGDLKPVPDEYYRDRMVPEVPVQILSPGAKEPLAALRFVPWQDGGVIVLTGKFPLSGLLMFAGLKPNSWTVLRQPGDLQVSSVLPMDRGGFAQLLRVAGGRSNLRFHQPKEQFFLQKGGDEGTASPYIARLMLGLLTLRDQVYSEDEAGRLAFDRLFEAMHQSLSTCRENVTDLTRLWRDHLEAVTSGKVVERGGQAIRITESIDKPLRREVADFLISAVRVSKYNLQSLARLLGAEIGFLFQQPAACESGLARLGHSDPRLADYLRQTRGWSEELVLARNAIEHEGWVLPRVTYRTSPDAVVPEEPEIRGVPVTRFAERMLDRTCCFVEDLVAHLLMARFGGKITLATVPPAKRTASSPLRFTITLASGGLTPWALVYDDVTFLER